MAEPNFSVQCINAQKFMMDKRTLTSLKPTIEALEKRRK